MLYSKIEDALLISSYASGDERAFETLLNRHGDAVFHTIFSRSKTATEATTFTRMSGLSSLTR